MRLNARRSRQEVKRWAQAGRLAYHATQDAARFWRHASLSTFDSTFEQLVGRIMYNVHALEKGLAQTDTWSPGRGKKALKNLNDAMAIYRARGYDTSSFAYEQGMSIVQRYLERHTDYPEEVSFLPELVDNAFRNPAEAASFRGAGTKRVTRQQKLGNAQKTFYELAEGRSSVRSFSGLPVDTAGVRRALEAAEKTPSVCNRQSWKVYWTEDKALAAQVLRHQRGFAYRQMPEVLLTVTVSNSAFVSPVERNQGFIDGGLYSMSVLYGLEAEGLAAVPLNACLYARDRKAVMSLLAIDESEEIIMFIAVGDHPEEAVVPMSDRRPTSTFLRRR